MTLLAVDAGRSEVEYKSKHGIDFFPSDVAIATERLNPYPVVDDLEIEVDGKKWWVGRLAQSEGTKINNFSRTKVNEILKVQVIAAIIYAKLENEKIDLGVLTPIDGFTDEETDSIKMLLKGSHTIKYYLVEKTNEKPSCKNITIHINERILIGQEGAVAYWSDPQAENTQTLDFGAKTINFSFHEYYKGQSIYTDTKSGTEWEGWETMKAKNRLSHKEDSELTTEEIDIMAFSLAKVAFTRIDKLGWSKDAYTQVFGGVAKEVFPYIKDEFQRAVLSHDPRNANCVGLFKLLEEVHAYA
jgi:plasmid segregation protein ParM